MNCELSLDVKKLLCSLSLLFFQIKEITEEDQKVWKKISALLDKFEDETDLIFAAKLKDLTPKKKIKRIDLNAILKEMEDE